MAISGAGVGGVPGPGAERTAAVCRGAASIDAADIQKPATANSNAHKQRDDAIVGEPL
jgi:hypothetical protein